MLDCHIARTGAPPRRTAADGGYASRANLAVAKARGVADVAFHKSCGPIITKRGGAPASSTQGETPAGMQAAPKGSGKKITSEKSE